MVQLAETAWPELEIKDPDISPIKIVEKEEAKPVKRAPYFAEKILILPARLKSSKEMKWVEKQIYAIRRFDLDFDGSRLVRNISESVERVWEGLKGWTRIRIRFSFPKIRFVLPKIKFSFPKFTFNVPVLKFNFPRFAFAIPTFKLHLPAVRFHVPKIKFKMPILPKIKFNMPKINFGLPKIQFGIPNIFKKSQNESIYKEIIQPTESVPQPDVGQPAAKLSSVFMKPIETLGKAKIPNLTIVFLVFVAVIALALGQLFYREMTLRKQDRAQLSEFRQAKSDLEMEIGNFKKELDQNKIEMNRLLTDLEVAKARGDMIDTIQDGHRQELARVAKVYEDQVASMRNVIAMRDDLIKTFESNLESIRKLLEGGISQTRGYSKTQPLASQVPVDQKRVEPIATASGSTRREVSAIKASVKTGVSDGKVMLVNRWHRFVIVNIGPSNGAQIGRTVEIYQNGKLLGTGKIERVYQTLSAASIISEDVLERVNSGDAIYLGL
ncbi:MAG: hypothetical protein A3G33_02110 [Omnitrophica bacterium RIFCSPLOWO2_12_FULL_44_17]|uniref:Uncharacterized protein n=1 Tax=Candidatus Danuiimicrobium aquiferis TaxID=1801832 RepID=A0A1G1KT95_9BACT|nr:MAG: hypothetical protein A3B72_04220 [Omnitrophica bacterium RIFCSPHIGHO2_02_FULL_45_28]OGW91947.1 MAG: hypothetical protein A3E74_10070 [Omnitrophica bacterium RIFCSPHIGHO2_12_FULL_44_12]OGW96130.1 MAG: hypothetical protein A3G33_02110 [Omnitrophica bacterium RIFCSPLOWO2_12_FULL_44_17]OGX01760.1 MAG: hypothetical protein A3J12_03725 [Omnitrophica bacterium RIFCSPLOWO2_02_FULL_44_11]